jgi:hypothetical protein
MPLPTPTPSPQQYNPTRDAEAYRSLVWGNIQKFVRSVLKVHHYQHEPGGSDEVRIPLGGLEDVALGTAVADGNALIYSAAGTCWTNGAGSGGSSNGQAFFETAGTVTTGSIAGPTNLTGTALTITRVLVAADGEVAGNVTAGGAFSFAAGGGSDNNTGLSYTWADGAQLSMTISSAGGDVTYVTADVLFTR